MVVAEQGRVGRKGVCAVNLYADHPALVTLVSPSCCSVPDSIPSLLRVRRVPSVVDEGLLKAR